LGLKIGIPYADFAKLLILGRRRKGGKDWVRTAHVWLTIDALDLDADGVHRITRSAQAWNRRMGIRLFWPERWAIAIKKVPLTLRKGLGIRATFKKRFLGQ